ncbi:hypothetical protein NTGBS_560019 [Candidatus Nitrotoga sp. BS]|nr:hypothetical protein NTGBS_560019 [Candidatus Nitrotoga sp. BS]
MPILPPPPTKLVPEIVLQPRSNVVDPAEARKTPRPAPVTVTEAPPVSVVVPRFRLAPDAKPTNPPVDAKVVVNAGLANETPASGEEMKKLRIESKEKFAEPAALFVRILELIDTAFTDKVTEDNVPKVPLNKFSVKVCAISVVSCMFVSLLVMRPA